VCCVRVIVCVVCDLCVRVSGVWFVVCVRVVRVWVCVGVGVDVCVWCVCE